MAFLLLLLLLLLSYHSNFFACDEIPTKFRQNFDFPKFRFWCQNRNFDFDLLLSTKFDPNFVSILTWESRYWFRFRLWNFDSEIGISIPKSEFRFRNRNFDSEIGIQGRIILATHHPGAHHPRTHHPKEASALGLDQPIFSSDAEFRDAIQCSYSWRIARVITKLLSDH
jgi:hypothetical protein